jgi:hypothetical protein
MKNGITASKLLISLTALAVSLCGSAAFADPPKSDWFSRSTNPSTSVVVPAKPSRPLIEKPPERLWFEALDEQVKNLAPTENEQFILTRSFGSPPQQERVTEWTNTALSVAKKFHEIARYLNSTPIPDAIASDPQANDLTTYRQELAQWYTDSATWLEDYIKPRPAARTIEELDGQIKAMGNRSEQQKVSMVHLQEMDSKLREHFKIHKTDDSIWKYASGSQGRHDWAKVKELPKQPH